MHATRVEHPALAPEQLTSYAGSYFSHELGVRYAISVRTGKLMLTHPRGEVELVPIHADEFIGGFPVGRVRFTRDEKSKGLRGFTVDNGRVKNLAFTSAT